MNWKSYLMTEKVQKKKIEKLLSTVLGDASFRVTGVQKMKGGPWVEFASSKISNGQLANINDPKNFKIWTPGGDSNIVKDFEKKIKPHLDDLQKLI